MAGIPWVVQPGVIATAGDVRVEAGEVFWWVNTESIQQACKFKENEITQFPYLSTRDLNCVICDTVPRKRATLGQIVIIVF